jgi:hypothetical protein
VKNAPLKKHNTSANSKNAAAQARRRGAGKFAAPINAAVSFIPRNLNDIAIAKTAAKISRAKRMDTRDKMGDGGAIGVPFSQSRMDDDVWRVSAMACQGL